MLRVGLTGSIGSGKSTVLRVFSALGVPGYSADQVSKHFLSQSQVQARVLQIFPHLSNFSSNFSSFTRALGQEVFSHPHQIEQLNAILHPLVLQEVERWFNLKEKQGYLYAVVEAAILIESGMYKKMDSIITVESTRELQISRTCKRDHCLQKEVQKRIDCQISPELRRSYAQFVLQNNDIQPLLLPILDLDARLRKS